MLLIHPRGNFIGSKNSSFVKNMLEMCFKMLEIRKPMVLEKFLYLCLCVCLCVRASVRAYVRAQPCWMQIRKFASHSSLIFHAILFNYLERNNI